MSDDEYEPWHHDSAHMAVDGWVRAWRETNGRDVKHPPLRFGEHLGREAVAMQNEDVPRIEMQRIFSAAGFDGCCVCGLKPGDPIGEAK